ncbi:hypothetical protein HPSA20_1583 [Helicobacter pylori SouthAfrica20]|uniref:Uncharacterized protein n=1 Tax=Helicobacter pylori SouthAfrica20 TaxID=1352356 RepID=T1UBP1_HELPX|nr:hypothetical protein HPSA20_1583 [Helicobacter pylori SouthAfrica20]
MKNYRLIFNSKQNPKKLILRYNVSLYYDFSHRSLLDKLYPLISSKKLGGERYFTLTLETSATKHDKAKSQLIVKNDRIKLFLNL